MIHNNFYCEDCARKIIIVHIEDFQLAWCQVTIVFRNMNKAQLLLLLEEVFVKLKNDSKKCQSIFTRL